VRLTGSLGGYYDFGTLQDSSGGLSLGLDLLVPYVSFGLAMLGLPQDETDLPADDASYRYAAGRFRACARNPFSGQFGAALCSGFTVGERTLDPGASGGFAGALVQLEISRRVVGPFGVFADLDDLPVLERADPDPRSGVEAAAGHVPVRHRRSFLDRAVSVTGARRLRRSADQSTRNDEAIRGRHELAPMV
jgi:hypothetical protein